VRSLIEKSNGLLFVDNLETVDDARIIQFLDSLPVGVRAITTSRRTSVEWQESQERAAKQRKLLGKHEMSGLINLGESNVRAK
jgi:hypothetical protein